MHNERTVSLDALLQALEILDKGLVLMFFVSILLRVGAVFMLFQEWMPRF
jgi:hypothetical protein